MQIAGAACLVCLLAAETEPPQINPTPRPVIRQVAAEWDFAGGTGSWRGESRCEITAGDGRLVVRLTGKDPHMHSRVAVAGGDMVLEYRARSTAAGPARIYWMTEQSPRRGGDKSRAFEVIHDGQWHEYSIPFRAPGNLTDIRLDPADAAGEVEIEWIRLVRESRHPLVVERVEVAGGEVRFTVVNHGAEAIPIAAQNHEGPPLEAGTSRVLTIPLKRNAPVEQARLLLAAPGLPEVSRSVFVFHQEVAVAWLELPMRGGKLQIAPDGSAGRVLLGEQPVAILAPLVQCGDRIPDLAPASTSEGLLFRGEGIEVSIGTEGNEIRFSIRSDGPCEGPVVRPLGDLEQGLLAGLEHLGKGETSSTKLDVETDDHLRFAPDPRLVTMPLMSIVTDRAAVSMTWDDMTLAPVFATPNFFDGTSDHRMALRGLRIEAAVRVERETLPEAIVWAIVRRGLPPWPPAPRTPEQQYALCLRALNGPLKTSEGWGHGVEERWPRRYFADVASTVFRLTDQVPTQRDLVPGGSHISNESVYLLANKTGPWRQMQLEKIEALIQQQQPDGSFRYSGKYGRGHFEDTASGFCARPAVEMLEYARITGDPRSLEAALKTLETMKRFRTPRGAQTWEVPLHTPDLLASAYLVWAYVRGYELTGDESYLAEARKWAVSGLPFVYQWGDQPVMPYAAIPALGASDWRSPVWFGLPVPWVGTVYAYALAMLASHDQTLDWNHLAWGILIAAEQMQYPDGPHAGLLPDAFALKTQQRLPWSINPCGLVSLRRVLEGELDAIAVAADQRHRVAAPFPVRIEGEQAIIRATAGVPYQVMIDGRRIVGVRSKGRDVLDLKE